MLFLCLQNHFFDAQQLSSACSGMRLKYNSLPSDFLLDTLRQLNLISRHVIFSSVNFLFRRQRGVNKLSTRPAACSAVDTFKYCQRCSSGFCFVLFFCYLPFVLCSLHVSLNYTRRLDFTVTLPLVNEFPVSDEDASSF